MAILLKHTIWPNDTYEQAAHALSILINIRDIYNKDWKPNWKDTSDNHILYYEKDELKIERMINRQRVLHFKTSDMAYEFMKHYSVLINIAKPLL